MRKIIIYTMEFGGVENINAERYHIVEMNSKDEISLHVQDEIKKNYWS